MSEKKDFFISYTKTDHRWAEWVAWQLKAEGFSTVIQVWDIRPGANFVHEMDKAAAQAERLIAVLSPAYLDSPVFSDLIGPFHLFPTAVPTSRHTRLHILARLAVRTRWCW